MIVHGKLPFIGLFQAFVILKLLFKIDLAIGHTIYEVFVYYCVRKVVNVMWSHRKLVLALCSVRVSALAGIEFGDNFNQDYLTEQNGIAIARTQVKHIR